PSSGVGRISSEYDTHDRAAAQSALIPAARITLPHFSVSSAICLPKSEGEPTTTDEPRSANLAFRFGVARPALISLLSLSTISTGVLLGAPTPNQPLASYPGTKSPTVGKSGNASERADVVTASARSLPPLTYSIDEDNGLNIT